jgi:predicted nucleic acid binding AN1-type Zn finger protein
MSSSSSSPPCRSCGRKCGLTGTECKYCKASFCLRCRLPEDHECGKIADMRDAEFERNRAELIDRRCKKAKVDPL